MLSLTDFVANQRAGQLPATAAAITFDDGYLDNLTEAAAVLRQYDVPATLFLATGPMRSGQPYWWDELADIVFDPAPLQACLAVGERRFPIALGRAEAADANLVGWRAWHAPRSARQALYVQLWTAIRALPAPALGEAAMAALRAIRGVLRGTARDETRRPMSTAEVERLIADTTFTLAGHTVDHCHLPSVSDEEVGRQVLAGRQHIAALTGGPVAGFAYPYGGIDARTRDLVESAGVQWACTTQGGAVRAGCDLLALPRLTAVDRPSIGWTRFMPGR